MNAAAPPPAPPVLAGLSAAGRVVPVALLAALPGLMFLAGFDHLAYGLGVLAGVVLAGLLIAPRVAGVDAHNVADALHRRFGRAAGFAGSVVVVLVLFPLLAAELTIVGTLAERLGALYAAAVLLTLAVGLTAALTLGERGFGWLGTAAYMLIAAAILVPLSLLAYDSHGLVVPQLAYGRALPAIAALEERLLEQGLVDFDTFSAQTATFLRLSRLDVVALVVSLALGTAVLLSLLQSFGAAAPAGRARLVGAWTALFVMIVLVSVPALAAYAKLAIYGAAAAGSDAEAVTIAEPLDLLLALPALVGVPGWMAVAAVIAAAVVIVAVLTRTLLAALGVTGGPNARVLRERRLGLASAAVVAALAAAAAAIRPGEILVPMVVSSLSLAAAGLLPALLALTWKRATAAGVVAAIVVGASVSLYYEISIRVFPAAFYSTWPGLSNAGEAAVEEFRVLEDAVHEAEDDEARRAAREALDDLARGTPTRAGLANWAGIDSASSAVFAVPLGLAVLVLVSLASSFRARREPSAETE